MSAPAFAGRIGLTVRQRHCFEAIEQYVTANKCSPSLEDIAVMLNLRSKGGIVRLLQALEERGWIRTIKNRSRSITILPDVEPSGYVLPLGLDAKLRAHCAKVGDAPADVVADAVALFLDEQEADLAA